MKQYSVNMFIFSILWPNDCLRGLSNNYLEKMQEVTVFAEGTHSIRHVFSSLRWFSQKTSSCCKIKG